MPERSPAGLPHTLRDVGRTLVMGVVNVTPDSFSDGGMWFEPTAAVEHGRSLLAEGADILDVGGESTRPGAGRVDEAEELRRVLPVVTALAREGAVVSIDTMRSGVARAALDAGAVLVNDVSGGLADPAMARAVAGAGVPLVIGHWRGHSAVMDSLDDYDDVVTDVVDHLRRRVDALAADGVDPRRVVVDPGLGFAKPGASNWPLLARLDELMDLGHPVLVGASRKRFLGHVLARARSEVAARATGGPTAAVPEPVPPAERDAASAAVSALAAAAGVWAVRVHAVAPSFDAVVVAAAWRAAAQVRQPGRSA